MKILKAGARSIHDNSPWTPGKWRKATNCTADGDPCATGGKGGYHTLKGDDPLISPVFTFPCEVWVDECRGLLGEDATKARYRQQRIVENITDQFPQLVAVNKFVAETIPSVKWFQAQEPEPWMVVEDYASLNAAWSAALDAALDAAWSAARSAARDAAWSAARDAAWSAAWSAAWNAARDAAWDAALDAALDAAWDAAWDAAIDADSNAASLLVSDLEVDTTWLHRWWRAWELGYYPIREDGDKLVVGRIAAYELEDER